MKPRISARLEWCEHCEHPIERHSELGTGYWVGSQARCSDCHLCEGGKGRKGFKVYEKEELGND